MLALSLGLPGAALAAGMPDRIVPCDGVGQRPCTCADLTAVAQNIINTSIFVAIFLSAILIAWAGWKMISSKSMGSGEGVSQGKEVLSNVIIGLVIIIAAWLIVDTIVKTITSSGTAQQVWNTICPR
jgi:hypothetical protein